MENGKARIKLPRNTEYKNNNNFSCDTKYRMNEKGKFFNSKYPNPVCRLFDKRVIYKKSEPSNEPSPGTYNLSSEFKIY